ncbi:haloacid dehalogenase [Arthrobacter sp. MYb227]|uniref:HAD family hydrolase n=1 Tax=Arthrobacter sp. MYb227 TaxID=1848601 RepID=UPI000CFC6237|nr:HAD family phosphatase [Arthrobacter sp. MYb227]PQZ93918.1 haloacid dehalogenase [Arthrobacter sp. MYb227]
MPTLNSASCPAPASNSLLQGVLWDMDGTLLDTEPYWMAAEGELVAEFGGSWSDDDALALVGNALPDSALVLQRAGVKLSEREIIDRLTTRVMEGINQHIEWRPGALELLEELHQAGIVCGLVTMSESAMATQILARLPKKYFAFQVTGDQVSNGKPHPEPYLVGLKKLAELVPDLDVTRVVGLEDSFPGISSAAAAGLKAVLIPHIAAVPESANWHLVESLTQVNVETLCTLTGIGAS